MPDEPTKAQERVLFGPMVPYPESAPGAAAFQGEDGTDVHIRGPRIEGDPDRSEPYLGRTSIRLLSSGRTYAVLTEKSQLAWRNRMRRHVRRALEKINRGESLTNRNITPDYLRGLADGCVVEESMSHYVAEATRRLRAAYLELAEVLERQQGTRRSGVPSLPTALAQRTFQEMRNVGIGLADGPSGRRWVEVDEEAALFHAIDGQPIQVRFSPSSPLQALWNEPATHDHLRAELEQAGAPAVLLAHVAVGLVIEQGKVTIALDGLRRLIGWTRREAERIDQERRRVWRMLLLIESLRVIGKRPGKYRDPRTKQVVDLVSRDPLIVVRGERYAAGTPTGQDVPLDVSIDAGAWIDEHRGNRQVLTNFGDVLKLARIPAGKPAGAWAQSVGLALNQRWRERAARADIARVGEDAHPTVRFGQHFTRCDLLEMFRAEPYYRDVLDGDHPSRAREYWNDAIKLLKNAGVVGHYAEVEPLPAGRQGWQGAWLAQPLDIRPTEDGRHDAAEIKRAAIVAAKAKAPRRRAKA